MADEDADPEFEEWEMEEIESDLGLESGFPVDIPAHRSLGIRRVEGGYIVRKLDPFATKRRIEEAVSATSEALVQIIKDFLG